MPLTRNQKEEAITAIAGQLDAATSVYLTDYQGLTVDQSNKLRRAFRAANIDYKVLKNTLLRRVMEDRGGFDELYDQLNGPTAVAFTTDPAAPAKVLKKFLETNNIDLPRFKGAYIDGAIYDGTSLDALATLKSKDELIADILGLLLAPITNIASALGAQGAGLASVIEQIADGKGPATSASTTEPAAEAAPAADDDEAETPTADADEAPADDATSEAAPADDATDTEA
jgi:large subunit ribosomal protein L10